MVTIKFIKRLVEEKTNYLDLSLNTRKEEEVQFRNIAIYLCRIYISKKRATYENIAEVFGIKNHSSINHCIRSINDSYYQKWWLSYKKILESCRQDILNEIEGKNSVAIKEHLDKVLEMKLGNLLKPKI